MENQSKLKSLPELKEIIRRNQASGTRVVLANGCFDILHVGHVRYLEAARALGEALVVAVNSDRAVTLLKGPGRPIQPQEERAEIVGSLQCVDYVTVFDTLTADDILGELRPDVHAKGTDYTVQNVPEIATVRSYGGSVAIVGDAKEHATKDLIEIILSRFSRDPS